MYINLSSFYNIVGTFIIDNGFEDIIDIVLQCMKSMEPLFSNRREAFVDVIDMCCLLVNYITTSIKGQFVNCSGSGIVYQFSERWLWLLLGLAIIVVDTEVLLVCLYCSFAKSISL